MPNVGRPRWRAEANSKLEESDPRRPANRIREDNTIVGMRSRAKESAFPASQPFDGRAWRPNGNVRGIAVLVGDSRPYGTKPCVLSQLLGGAVLCGRNRRSDQFAGPDRDPAIPDSGSSGPQGRAAESPLRTSGESARPGRGADWRAPAFLVMQAGCRRKFFPNADAHEAPTKRSDLTPRTPGKTAPCFARFEAQLRRQAKRENAGGRDGKPAFGRNGRSQRSAGY